MIPALRKVWSSIEICSETCPKAKLKEWYKHSNWNGTHCIFSKQAGNKSLSFGINKRVSSNRSQRKTVWMFQRSDLVFITIAIQKVFEMRNFWIPRKNLWSNFSRLRYFHKLGKKSERSKTKSNSRSNVETLSTCAPIPIRMRLTLLLLRKLRRNMIRKTNLRKNMMRNLGRRYRVKVNRSTITSTLKYQKQTRNASLTWEVKVNFIICLKS